MKTIDGGPAFPRPSSMDGDTEAWSQEGLSLRDYFAGQALAGVLAAEAHPSAQGAVPVDEGAALYIAKHCYTYADAMIKARSESTQ